MVRWRSDPVQVAVVGVTGAVFALLTLVGMGLLGRSFAAASVRHFWVVPFAFLVVGVVGWQYLEWGWSPAAVVVATAVTGPVLLGAVFLVVPLRDSGFLFLNERSLMLGLVRPTLSGHGVAFASGALLYGPVFALVVGGLLALSRPGFFGPDDGLEHLPSTVRLRSDAVQVVVVGVAGAVLALLPLWVLGLVERSFAAASVRHFWMVPLAFLVVAVVGWQYLAWESSPLWVVAATALVGPLLVAVVYIVHPLQDPSFLFTNERSLLLGVFRPGIDTEGLAFAKGVLTYAPVTALLWGGSLALSRPEFFGRVTVEELAGEAPEPSTDSTTRTATPDDGPASGASAEPATVDAEDGVGSEAPSEVTVGHAPDTTESSVGSAERVTTGESVARAEPTVRELETGFDAEYDAFDVGELIGSGGTADVHLATIDLPSGEHEVALKTPRVTGDETVDTDFFEQFRAEAETWDRLDDHENVVSVYDWGENPQPWIALEYMEAGDLGAWADRLDLEGKLAAVVDVCEAVHHAHTHGVNHTDLKPGNVLFTERTGDGVPPWVAKVGDWGLANVLLEHSRSVDGFTPDYAAPEQVDPEQYGRTDHRTDIYQVGVVAYELLTGRPPFDHDHHAAAINAVLNEDPQPASAVNPDLPSTLDDMLGQALAKEKADRQDTVVYLRDAFDDLR